jgi:hypothetical protein
MGLFTGLYGSRRAAADKKPTASACNKKVEHPDYSSTFYLIYAWIGQLISEEKVLRENDWSDFYTQSAKTKCIIKLYEGAYFYMPQF